MQFTLTVLPLGLRPSSKLSNKSLGLTCGLELPQEVQPVGGLSLVTVNDERDDERVDDGDHEELGRDEVVGEFPEKKSRVRIPQKSEC